MGSSGRGSERGWGRRGRSSQDGTVGPQEVLTLVATIRVNGVNLGGRFGYFFFCSGRGNGGSPRCQEGGGVVFY